VRFRLVEISTQKGVDDLTFGGQHRGEGVAPLHPSCECVVRLTLLSFLTYRTRCLALTVGQPPGLGRWPCKPLPCRSTRAMVIMTFPSGPPSLYWSPSRQCAFPIYINLYIPVCEWG